MRCHRPPLWLLILASLGTAVLLAACSSSSSSPGGSSSSASASPDTGGESNNTAEQPGVHFESSRFHYTVDAPGPVVEAADGSIRADRGVESLQISVNSASSVADPRRFSQDDVAQLQATTSQFRLVDALVAITINNRAAMKVVFAAPGTNAVTGRVEDRVTARYYIPRDSSTLAVLTYSVAANQYDPQGADDQATTFVWL
jgi:hypothetical protein